jgi:hypothetical protein
MTMQVATHKRVPSHRRSQPTAGRPETAEIVSGDAPPCPNSACRARGWPLVAKPRNWPWAQQCWNCGRDLR